MVPSHSHHDQFVLDRLPSANPKLFESFHNRNAQASFKDLALSFDQANIVLVDRQDSLQLLKELYPNLSDKFHHLSPLIHVYDWEEVRLEKNRLFIIN